MRLLVALLVGAASATVAVAQQAREITFFSNSGYGGARFTVTGPRTTLNLPFAPRSAAISGGGSWSICPQRDYGGRCQTLSSSQRELRLSFSSIGSVRPLGATPAPAPSTWRELGRLNVRDRAEEDTLPITDGRQYREVMVCAERNTVRIRRAQVRLNGGQWQRLFLPLAIAAGRCSDAVDLAGNGRRITAFRFEYEAWTPGWAGARIVVRANPQPVVEPR